ncbi:TetR/AcrR family transcriptional regulator [Nocardioides bizhenqiangii]|uniref:TetR/AcrR family transcriptional regulator n=1 Tax=Nocardioides bizhenqiangii TaxID=3095076 RepID=A0ABZ0ZT54_9ACTN|nr:MULTISPECIES: TetR/AcrR family transcriptional regulator [unclassified Nocardioides]MDZ5619299.1 TetR/AcrR family transcriptional regulator [Nocardioides sp. HM23]WQQ26678.1 TetR/AcrR family transcriptional regulator [Nocardioides sp. HM61]
MASLPQTARSERTREALRRAAMVRFLAQGVEDTSAEQIAADAGVSLRTFYRHFNSKHDLLFADYDAGLQWFRHALADRPAGEPIVESVLVAVFAFPYDAEAVTQIANMRANELDPGRIVRHMREVQADFAHAIRDHLARRSGDPEGEALEITVTARCVAAAVFAGMEVWMHREERSLDDLAVTCRTALTWIDRGLPIH